MKTAARLCYLLIALLITQSAAAFYDSHQQRQNIADHVPGHHTDVADHVDNSDQHHLGENALSQDCHHCCHCHGSAHFFALGPAINAIFPEQQRQLSRFVAVFHSLSSPPDLHPPIA